MPIVSLPAAVAVWTCTNGRVAPTAPAVTFSAWRRVIRWTRVMGCSCLVRDNRHSTQPADVAFEQGPALAAELLAPRRIDRGHARAERGLVDLVEDHASLGQGLAQACVE